MQTRIELITPVLSQGVGGVDDLAALARPDLTVSQVFIERGPASIESDFDDALCVPDVIRKAIEAERGGASAIVIDCMGDPGLHACREVVAIPVVGPCQATLHAAAMLGHRFGYVSVMNRLRPVIGRMVAEYGLREAYASFRAVDIPVLQLGDDRKRLVHALTKQALAAVLEDGAEVIVLGCTGFIGCAAAIREGLLESGVDVPVIDPIPLAVHTADALVRAGISHSKRTYPRPSAKRIVGFEFPEFVPGG